MILSADVMTNPPIPPKILSDSLIIISAIPGFNWYSSAILIPYSDALILSKSTILPCEFEMYFVEITMTSPSCNLVSFFTKVFSNSSKILNLFSILSASSGITVNCTIFYRFYFFFIVLKSF